MSLFPLPLTSFEEYLFRDDYPGYPHTLSGRFRFRGRLSLSAAAEAHRLIAERHPLVCCRVVEERRRLFWEPVPYDVDDLKLVKRDSVADVPQFPGIDLRRQAGGQMLILHDDEQCDVVIHGHHACVDGVGALQLMLDWMSLYAQLIERPGQAPTLRSLRPETLRRRGDYGFGRWSYFKKLHRQAIGLFGIHEFLNHQAVSLVPDSLRNVDEAPPEPYPGVVTVEWNAAQLAAHRQLAAQFQVTSNELILAGLIKSLSHWRKDRGWGDPSDWLRVMVPYNMRQFEHRAMPAANRVSFVSLDRKALPFNRFGEFTQTIKTQMDIIRKNDLDLIFLALLGVYHRLPGGVGRLARADRCGATTILTNLGEPFRRSRLPRENGKLKVGDLVLERCEMLPPLRPHTNVSFSAFRYAQRQCLTASFDRRVLQQDDVQELLDRLSGFVQGK